MDYVKLGRSDLKVSVIGLGAWQIGEPGWDWGTDYTEKDVVAAFERAFELGINFIDTAEVYGDGVSEEVIGRLVKGCRDDLVIATKVSGQHLRYNDVLKAAEGSLRRLGIDIIDLYQVHWPNNYVPVSETMRALDKLLEQGRIRYVGVSNFPVCLLREAQASLKAGEIVSNQVRYNLLQRDVEKEILPYCLKDNIAIIAFSPLAQGLLTGKYSIERLPKDRIRQENPLFRDPENLKATQGLLKMLQDLGRKYGKTASQIALNWLLHDPLVVPIPGIKRQTHVEDNAGAAGWHLSPEDILLLNEASSRITLTYF